MAEGYQKRLNRVRKRRPIGALAIMQEEDPSARDDLPFVVGILGDFSGNGTRQSQSLKNREFVTVDRDNLDDVLNRFQPTLKVTVEENQSESQVELTLRFRSMEDFSPAEVAKQIPELQQLLDVRQRLATLLEFLPENDPLQAVLAELVQAFEEDLP